MNKFLQPRYIIDIQNACSNKIPISKKLLRYWATRPLSSMKTAELTVRLVEPLEITQLNAMYRNQDKPTNVLAFPSNLPNSVKLAMPFLGDIIVCPKVLLEESQLQKKALINHWAHIIIHGVLHLLGHDHILEEESALMHAQEIALLADLGFANPYCLEDNYFE